MSAAGLLNLTIIPTMQGTVYIHMLRQRDDKCRFAVNYSAVCKIPSKGALNR